MLTIWAEYCAESAANARRFVEDSIRDELGLVDAFEGLINTNSSLLPMGKLQGVPDQIQQARTNMLIRAQQYGILEGDKKFKPVSSAASDLGVVHSSTFKHLNILLSKFAHPTAFYVMSVVDENAKEALIGVLMEFGYGFANRVITKMEEAKL
jgi:hypothetical protein